MDLLHRLASADTTEVLQALEECLGRLKRSDTRPTEATAIGAALVPLARHESMRVRRLVARVLEFAPEEHFDAAIYELRKDDHSYVRADAEKTFHRVGKKRRIRQLRDTQGAHLAHHWADFKSKHGADARRDAHYLHERGLEFWTRNLVHEGGHFLQSISEAVNNMGTLLSADRLDRAALVDDQKTAAAALERLRDFLDRARQVSGMLSPRFETRALHAAVLDVVDEFRAGLADPTRLAARISVPRDLELEFDPGLVHQALTNLVVNASEAYAKDAPIRIDITATATGGRVTIAVTDHGVGISSQSLPHVMDPFCSGKGRGRGLGLTIVKQIVEAAHDGTVAIESERGKGTTVSLTLPKRQPKL